LERSAHKTSEEGGVKMEVQHVRRNAPAMRCVCMYRDVKVVCE
jgi:hypothetical protein